MANNNAYPNQNQERELDLIEAIKPLRDHWVKFGLYAVLLCCLGLTVVACLTPTFRSAGSLYIDDKPASVSIESVSSLLPDIGGQSNLESEKELLRSRDLAENVIVKLGLNADLDGPTDYLPARLIYGQWRWDPDPKRYNNGLVVRQSRVMEPTLEDVRYAIRFTAPDQFVVENEQQEIANGTLGEVIKTPDAVFALEYLGGPQLHDGLTFQIAIEPLQAVFQNFSDALSIKVGGTGARSASLLYIGFVEDSPYGAKEVVDLLLNEYIALKTSWATSASTTTLKFVTDQINELRDEMGAAAQRLSEYQEDSGLVSLEPQVRAELDSLVAFEVELKQLHMRLRELEQLATSLDTGEPDFYLMAFVEDPLIQDMGKRLAEMNGKVATLRSQYQGDYPQLQQLLIARQSLQNDLQSTVRNYVVRVKNRHQELSQTVEQYRQRMASLPDRARALADFLRSNKVFEDLYLVLSHEKQKAKIAEASTMTNLRVVDQPRVPLHAYSPRFKLVSGLVLSASLFLAALIVIIPSLRVYWFTSVEEVKERFANNTVFAVVPFRGKEHERTSPLILENNARSPYMESIRLLRGNLLHAMANKKHQTVLVTSAMPRDGKTSIAANLAVAMVKSERVGSVLVIDADMYNPTLHGIFDAAQNPGLSDYLSAEAPLEQTIQSVSDHPEHRIDLISAGPVPPTPVDLVETDAMRQLLEYARTNYTFTLIDSSPFPMTSIASVLAPQVDRVLTICRVGATDRLMFQRHADELSGLTTQLGLIVNTSAKVSGYGRSGYGYGYGYGNYTDASDSSTTSKLKRLRLRRPWAKSA